MGTWGYKTFENDGASDWLYELDEASGVEFLLRPLKAVTKATGKADIDDCLEGLAAAEVLAGARYEPPRNLPRIAKSWVKRVGLVPQEDELRLALKALKKICEESEFADEWESAGELEAWRKEVAKLSGRLNAALRARAPERKVKPKAQRETLAEMIIAVAQDLAGPRREELQKKLAKLANPDKKVGGKLEGKTLNALTPLTWVASRGLVEEAKVLIARGAKVDGTVSFSGSPIDFAMQNGHFEMVELLLEAGADRHKALYSAISDDRFELVRLILSKGVNVNERRESGWTPVQWAAMQGAPNSLELLLGMGGELDCMNDNGYTPLHHAVCGVMFNRGSGGRHLEVVKMLVQCGANLNPVDAEGVTPLDLAEEAKAMDIVQFLMAHGARNGKGK